ncbi:elongation factor G [Collinsella stercoris]|uniref:Putative translation elongation factor G n=1 Tax=Collinsella stercoris DSM 13279 TaxID=445975 RepID=B6G7S2_9ACTN|nr:elongation factor G [Collinsella stercoris]EEA91657.1 putative translation elongation factor G [Collinsella stercoris DSM 13279]UEA44949.1 elongation factor G [Collinsella stercoris DSM 13279]UWP12528.1 elongation factor G [Collinsella stercoris]
MGAPKTGNVRNVVLVGQGGVGKTSLAEAMLHLSGKTARLGGHDGTKPTLDYDAEEVKREFSISTSIAPIDWKSARINVLDAPCYPDFIGDAYAAMSVCETALFVVDAAEGPQPTTVKLWYAAEDLRLARAVFVNRVDKENADFDMCLEMLRERFGTRLGAVTLPWGTGDDFNGIIDLVRMKARHCDGTKQTESEIPEELRAAAEAAHETLCELVAEADDDLMEKYLEGEPLTQEEVEGLLAKAIAQRLFVPVFAGSCVQEQGVNSLMDDIATYFPAPTDYGEMPLIDGDTLKISSEDDRPVVFVFKTLNDAQQGRLSFLKVLTGTIEPGMELVNARTRKGERLAHLNVMCGREMTEVGHAYAGDIVVVPKMGAETGDTLSVTGKVEAAAFKFPNSQYRIAIEAENRSDEDKLFTFIEKACEADPTMSIDRDEETGQTVISAVGEAQVSVLLNRLGDRTKVAAHIVPLRIPYRETIRRVASAQGRHKKQTGGAGQFGDCYLRVEPLLDGTEYEFVDEVVGGRIPRALIPAVDKGAQETMKDGVIAGYPLTGIRVACYDGSYHPVDSNEMAFRTAARIGLKKACEDADPVVLEPMENITVTIPESYAGAVMGDVSASRGRVTGMDSNERGETVVAATVPYAELVDYATRLRSLTRGTGDFTMEPAGYEQVPYDVQQKLVEIYEHNRAQGR